MVSVASPVCNMLHYLLVGVWNGSTTFSFSERYLRGLYVLFWLKEHPSQASQAWPGFVSRHNDRVSRREAHKDSRPPAGPSPQSQEVNSRRVLRGACSLGVSSSILELFLLSSYICLMEGTSLHPSEAKTSKADAGKEACCRVRVFEETSLLATVLVVWDCSCIRSSREGPTGLRGSSSTGPDASICFGKAMPSWVQIPLPAAWNEMALAWLTFWDIFRLRLLQRSINSNTSKTMARCLAARWVRRSQHHAKWCSLKIGSTLQT